MPEDLKESKAKKLAAARKKLKEYQAKEKRDSPVNQVEQPSHPVATIDVNNDTPTLVATALPSTDDKAIIDPDPNELPINIDEERLQPITQNGNNNSTSGLETIQILIAEKATLSSELNKVQNTCLEKQLENEELQSQFQMVSKRLEALQNEFALQQKSLEELRSTKLTCQIQMESLKSKYDDQTECLQETRKLLGVEKEQNQSLSKSLKETNTELELAKIRINQLSDEANITQDNRVESLTQTQFMYEQQIRDLQAMVQQLNKDKEQANQQYQTYVQHLKSELATLNEKNVELSDECAKLQEREKQFIDHISGLEKDIQKTIVRQDQFKEAQQAELEDKYKIEIDDLKQKLSTLESERCEVQHKIKSQEDDLAKLNEDNTQKETKIFELEKRIEDILSETPDSSKLLATMESDKIAASRALTQNDILKKQLDELELKFVQLTNDKADLVNKLDAEEYVNREIRNNFTDMENHIKSLDEKLHFKDEEMIRLTHENNDLSSKIKFLEQQMSYLQTNRSQENLKQNNQKDNSCDDHDHDDDNHHHHDHHNHDHHHPHDHHNHDHHDHHHDQDSEGSRDTGSEMHQPLLSPPEHDTPGDKLMQDLMDFHKNHDVSCENLCNIPPAMPTIEALHQLQSRFIKLMSQVAELTDEKQRLEHLVIQLQSETETIGEYITLYQTQRRILKQREYEKAAQLQLLLGEREEMREKITTLNKLVSNLGVELPNNLRLSEALTNTIENICIEPNVVYSDPGESNTEACRPPVDEAAMNKRLNSNESKEILVKIQNIITEIKESTKDIPPVNAADHLTCCSGKFEIV